MKCPECGSVSNRVIDSRPYKNNEYIRRRRRCYDCGYVFSTYESNVAPDSIPEKVADELISLLIRASKKANGKKIKITVED